MEGLLGTPCCSGSWERPRDAKHKRVGRTVFGGRAERGKEHTLRSQAAVVSPLFSCVTLGKALTSLCLSFLISQTGVRIVGAVEG